MIKITISGAQGEEKAFIGKKILDALTNGADAFDIIENSEFHAVLSKGNTAILIKEKQKG